MQDKVRIPVLDTNRFVTWCHHKTSILVDGYGVSGFTCLKMRDCTGLIFPQLNSKQHRQHNSFKCRYFPQKQQQKHMKGDNAIHQPLMVHMTNERKWCDPFTPNGTHTHTKGSITEEQFSNIVVFHMKRKKDQRLSKPITKKEHYYEVKLLSHTCTSMMVWCMISNKYSLSAVHTHRYTQTHSHSWPKLSKKKMKIRIWIRLYDINEKVSIHPTSVTSTNCHPKSNGTACT